MFCFYFLLDIKSKKFSGTGDKPEAEHCGLHSDRGNIFVEWFAINSYSSSYENFHQNGLVVKLFYSREHNEDAIAFFYKMS